MNIDDLKSKINNFKQDFPSFIKSYFINLDVEVYCGDDVGHSSVEQESFNHPAVFCGKVLGSVGSFIVLDCFGAANGKISSGNIIFINTDTISALKLFNSDRPISHTFVKSGSNKQKKMQHE